MINDNQPPKENIGARIPADWAAKLKNLAEVLHCSQTELITEAIGEYLEKDVTNITCSITRLERNLATDGGHEIVTNPGIDADGFAALTQLVEQLQLMNQTGIQQNTELHQHVTHIIHQNAELRNQVTNLTNQHTELNNQVANQIYNLARKIDNLLEQVTQIKQQPPTDRVTLVESVSADKFAGGITQTELCERFGIKPGSLARMAERAIQSPQNFLEDLTKWRYLVRPGQKRGRWHPPEDST